MVVFDSSTRYFRILEVEGSVHNCVRSSQAYTPVPSVRNSIVINLKHEKREIFEKAQEKGDLSDGRSSRDGVDAALTLTASRCAILVVSKHKLKERASMEEVSIIGVDLAKNVFQLHGAAADGVVVFRKKLSRLQFARFMTDHPACDVAMEACPSAHHWARELSAYGHSVRLIAPHYVKPFIKRQKNDAADAEAIVDADVHAAGMFQLLEDGIGRAGHRMML